MTETNTAPRAIKPPSRDAKRKITLLISAAALAVGVGLGSIFLIWRAHKGPEITDQVIETSRKMTSHEPVSFQFAYEIKDMSMAIMNKKGTRTAYSQFTLIFDCPSEICKKVLELNRAKIINAIFEVGGDFYTEDFEAPLAATGFQRFKDGVRGKTAEYFGKNAPSLVVLKDWVMN